MWGYFKNDLNKSFYNGGTPAGGCFRFLFGVELKKRHYLKQLQGRKHTVEEVYLVERNNVGNEAESREIVCV